MLFFVFLIYRGGLGFAGFVFVDGDLLHILVCWYDKKKSRQKLKAGWSAL